MLQPLTSSAELDHEHELQDRKALVLCFAGVEAVEFREAGVVKGSQECRLVDEFRQGDNIVLQRLAQVGRRSGVGREAGWQEGRKRGNRRW